MEQLNTGLHLVAGNEPFEVTMTRKSYQDPVVGKRWVKSKGKRVPVTLPAWMTTNFDGLKDFSTVTLKDAANSTVSNVTANFCPGQGPTARSRPDAPANSPYPQPWCGAGFGGPGNPFRLGMIWGIQTGWSTELPFVAPDDENPFGFVLPVGKYKLTVAVNKRYLSYFKIPAKQGTHTIDVTVVNAPIDSAGAATVRKQAEQAKAKTRSRSAAAAGGHSHAENGDPSRQLSAYAKEFRPATRRPATVSAQAVPKGPRPDLRSLPAWGIDMVPGVGPDGKPNSKSYLSFGATVWNAGDSPLVVDGFRRPRTDLMDAYQYFFDGKGKQVGSTRAGTMQWDAREGHRHWHFTNFAQYRLLKADKKIAVKSGKEAFCLANTDAVDYTVKNARWQPQNTSLATSCGQNTAVAVREVLDSGNGDTYTQDRPGQSFEVTDLPNGTYYVEVLANPVKKLTESNLRNNSSLRKVILSGPKGNRKVTVPPVHGIEG
jgi:hypothetical protein